MDRAHGNIYIYIYRGLGVLNILSAETGEGGGDEIRGTYYDAYRCCTLFQSVNERRISTL